MKTLFIQSALILALMVAGLFADEGPLTYSTNLMPDGKQDSVLVFGSESCPYCEVLKEDIAENDLIKQKLNGMKVVYISLDDAREYEIPSPDGKTTINTMLLRQMFKISATPSMVLLDEQWERVMTIPGYSYPEFFAIYLDYLKQDIYKEKELQDYLMDQGML